MPKLSTVCEHPSDIAWLSLYTWDTILIDCTWCSVRPFVCFEWDEPTIRTLQSLSTHIGIHVDGLYTQHELLLIQSSIAPLIQSGCIDTIRIQDPGLISWIRTLFPTVQIHINPETGIQNQPSVAALVDMGVDRLTLNSETPFSVVQQICAMDITCELLVQGPILIQYSRRRFLSDWNGSHVHQIRNANDVELPNRSFTFLNTQFGHFMFAHFHRCLATVPHKLEKVSAYWLLDARGQTRRYKKTAAQMYHQLIKNPQAKTSDAINVLHEDSGRRQLPGFFLVNHTDTDWRNFNGDHQKNILGAVISVCAKAYCVIEWQALVQLPARVFIRNRDQSTHEWMISKASTTSGDPITIIKPQDITVHPWRLGIQQKAIIQSKQP